MTSKYYNLAASFECYIRQEKVLIVNADFPNALFEIFFNPKPRNLSNFRSAKESSFKVDSDSFALNLMTLISIILKCFEISVKFLLAKVKVLFKSLI